jgi:hypothetical protein
LFVKILDAIKLPAGVSLTKDLLTIDGHAYRVALSNHKDFVLLEVPGEGFRLLARPAHFESQLLGVINSLRQRALGLPTVSVSERSRRNRIAANARLARHGTA